MKTEDNVVEQNDFLKKARVFTGEFSSSNPELVEAMNLLKGANYIVTVVPVEGMALEIYVYPTENRYDARRLDLQQLKMFLMGEEIPRSMWTIVWPQ